MQEAYRSAFFASPRRAYGRTLKPLGLWHCLCLEALGSPLALGGPVSASDAAVAAYVLTSDFAGLSVGDDLSGLDGWLAAITKDEHDEGVAAVLAHVEQYNLAPKRYASAAAEPPKVPWQILVAARLMSDLGFSEERAWTMPLPLALAYAAASSELSGFGTDLIPEAALANAREPVRVVKREAS